MDSTFGEAHVTPEITHVVDTITGRTARVYKILPGFGVQVWIKERGYERENWPWRMCTLRQPRLIKRYPRPLRFPREEPTQICHCRIGRMEVENVEAQAVRCQRCKNLVGSESYPNRIERATKLLRKAGSPRKIQTRIGEGVRRAAQPKTRRRRNHSVKARTKSSSPVVIRPTRRKEKRNGAGKVKTKRAAVPPRKRRALAVPSVPKK